MPSPKKTKSDDDSQKIGQAFSDDKKSKNGAPASKPAKEQEPILSGDEVISGIQERAKEADQKAEFEVQEAIGKEARLKEPEVEIPPDVADAGVVSPEKEASETLEGDTTIELPMSEDEYKKGEHTKLSAKVTQQKEVFGVSSIIALALYVGRIIKLAHHHAKRIVFKDQKEGD